MQANPFLSKTASSDFPPASGFTASIGETLLPLAEASRSPVLLIHGDSHRFMFDRPFKNAAGRVIHNLVRLQVFGAPDVHAVQVHVDTDQAEPFGVSPVYNPLSRR